MAKQCELTQLNQFLGKKCEVTIKLPNGFFSRNILKSFSYLIEDDKYHYINIESENDSILIMLKDILSVENTSEDIYDDCIKISTNDYIVEINLDELRPQIPTCYRCSKELLLEDSIYHIVGTPQFGSHFENQDSELQELNFCDDCVHDFVGGDLNE